MAKTRITVILNARRDLEKVLRNLAPVFRPDDTVLLYTSAGRDSVKKAFSDALGIDCGDFSGDVGYVRFNEYRSSDYADGKAPSVIVMRMPNELFHTIPTALNHALEFVVRTDIARYVHFFYDDLVVCDADHYRPSEYEWFMEKYGEPFLADCKLNRQNFVFRRLVPRLVFMSSRLHDKLSFYNFEGRDHFIVDRTKVDIRFDERIRRFYMIEFLSRAHKAGIVGNVTWYPDPVFAETVKRDPSFEQRLVDEQVVAEVREDEKYMRDVLKFDMSPEPEVEPVLRRIVTCIDPENASGFGLGRKDDSQSKSSPANADGGDGNSPCAENAPSSSENKRPDEDTALNNEAVSAKSARKTPEPKARKPRKAKPVSAKAEKA